jgi:L-ribulose-5-phosphate 3-epimerase
MNINRRKFLNTTALAAMAPSMLSFGNEKTESEAPFSSQQERKKNILIGIITDGNNPDKGLKLVQDLGFETCQLSVSQYTAAKAAEVKNAVKKYGIMPNALLVGGPGKMVWNFTEGPSTIGIIPRATRKERMQRMNDGIKFCAAAGLPAVHTHFGFIPENPGDPLYAEFIECLKELGGNAKKEGINILCETGQETPTTLQRAIEDAGTGNIFVNYDTANMALYGKANPLDGLKMLSKYVRSLHAKDGHYPTNPRELGREVPIPQGIVNFPAVISYLKEINFKGEIIIECEISGSNNDYIVQTRKYLEGLIAG